MANNYKSYLIPPAQFLSTCLRHTQKSIASRCVLGHTLLFNYCDFPELLLLPIFLYVSMGIALSANHCQWEVITMLNWVRTVELLPVDYFLVCKHCLQSVEVLLLLPVGLRERRLYPKRSISNSTTK